MAEAGDSQTIVVDQPVKRDVGWYVQTIVMPLLVLGLGGAFKLGYDKLAEIEHTADKRYDRQEKVDEKQDDKIDAFQLWRASTDASRFTSKDAVELSKQVTNNSRDVSSIHKILNKIENNQGEIKAELREISEEQIRNRVAKNSRKPASP